MFQFRRPKPTFNELKQLAVLLLHTGEDRVSHIDESVLEWIDKQELIFSEPGLMQATLENLED